MTTTHLCPCGTPEPDATICTGCTRALEIELGDVPAAVADLETSLARIGAARLSGPRSAETPLPWDDRAATALRDLHALLVSWVKLVKAENARAPEWPADRPSAVAGWLLSQIGWLRLHDEADQMLTEVRAQLANARHVVDSAPDRELVGMCTTCQTRLLARRGAAEVACRTCSTEHVVDEVRESARLASEDFAMHRAEIEHVLATFGLTVSRRTLSRWIVEHEIVPTGTVTVAGIKRDAFRLGDVMDLVRARCSVVR